MYPQIRALRINADMTQVALAQYLHLHRMTYVRYESGQREIPLQVAIALADFHHVTLDYLAGRCPPEK